MREIRGIVVRGAALVVGGVLAASSLTGCARTEEVDIAEALAADSAVASVEQVSSLYSGQYEIFLDDAVPVDELPEVAERLAGIVDDANDANESDATFGVHAGEWRWSLDGDAVAARAEAIAALSDIDGVVQGTAGVTDDGLFVTIIGGAGVDPSSFAGPVAEAVAAADLPEPVKVEFSDLHERRTIEGELEGLEAKIAAVQAAATAGEIVDYRVSEKSLRLRMRTAEAAAAATPVIQAAMGEAGGAADPVRFGLVVPGAGADPAAAAVVEQVLDGIPGVVTAEVDQRSRDTAVLIVTTADTAAAFTAQQALTADPATLLPYRSLQFTVENADRPGSLLRALATSDTGHVGNLDRAAALAETDGILGGVMVTPTALGATLTKDADVATVAVALKAAALRDQEAEIFVETAWEPYRPEAAYSFDVLGKLHPDLINGNGDQDAFVKAWNAAPGL